MKKDLKNIIIVSWIAIFWLGTSFITWINPSKEISESERRKLAQIPKLEVSSILSGKFMKDFEEYSKDQFPNRFKLRTLKAYTRFNLLAQRDNNNIYIEDGIAAKLEYPLNENSIKTANNKFNYLYENYMKDKNMNIFISVIPDKSYYLGASKGYPSMDYDKLFNLVKEGNKYAKYIDITDILSIDDYYKTDIHWKQENLKKVAKEIGLELDISDKLVLDFENVKVEEPFYGVYYGQSALPLNSDNIVYLKNNIIENCSVYNLEKNSTTNVYDIEKLSGRDPYDVYLSGATPLLVIDNPNAKTNRELIVFRDSFASSLIPLLLEGYSKVTMIDIRYMKSNMIGNYVQFNENQDVLFLYSSAILNSANILK